ncbi:siderophore-interacting protein [Sphaerisporangium sp. TRM90804]|uniref:siderophore-interacting protein n=1 Tax=Sphaerisporangium sp. TRM90804 TaxID=3031113 RepID=UPI002447C067|nr:siderophore-interacting protein [Sphaerisporangium sp. TRM90804]MDH2427344.1 siderophore-interacting protein [Sphaerisporangium sp. TRM90804]
MTLRHWRQTMTAGTEPIAELGPEPITELRTEEIPSYRAFHVTVVRRASLGSGFARVTFTGADLDLFADNGFDQRVKLVFPLASGGFDHFPGGPDWYRLWRGLPAGRRNPVRTYTVRAVRRALCEVDVDFVLHGDGGPASRWALAAGPGDHLIMIGPDARHPGPVVGREWAPPPSATRLLIAGDETAVPAVSSIAESLPADAEAKVLLEVPDAGDALLLDVPAGVKVVWLPRRGYGRPTAGHGDLLVAAVREALGDRGAPGRAPAGGAREADADAEVVWDVPGDMAAAHDGLYAWLAGEAGAVKRLRRLLVGEFGVDRAAVAFMGYWRLGRAESD